MSKYKDILGKSIIYNNQVGFVAGVDPKIGITIKPLDSDDPDDWLYCFTVKSGIIRGFTKKEINELFYRRVELIRKSVSLTTDDIQNLRKDEGDGIGIISPFGTCPFSS